MTIVKTASAAKVLTAAIPTVNAEGNVVSWKLTMEYSLNDYTSNFSDNVKIEEPAKKPEDYSKAELVALMNTDHLDLVFESQYTSVKMAEPSTETDVHDFDVNSLK